jgi:aspartate/methionine/tyrosine aminotransferase
MPAPGAAGLPRTVRIAARMREIEPFRVIDVFTRAKQLEAQGRAIVYMAVGEPDFPTPQPILDAAARFVAAGNVPYTQSLGIPPLKEAIARFYGERYGVRVPPERIAVTAGASAALLLALGVLVDPGDEVLMADPGYPCNRQFVRAMSGVPRTLPSGVDDRYQLGAHHIREHWTARSVAAIVASPSNPCGTTIAHDELGRVAAEVDRRGGRLVVDEIYLGLSYDSEARTALGLSDELFVVNSFSKYFHMTGWRLGWLVAPEAYVREVEKLAQNLYIAPSTVAQYAGLAAFGPDTLAIAEARRAEFKARRDYLVPALRRLGFGVPLMPEGAFYVYADCSAFTDDSYAFAFEALEQAGVAFTPGIDFGEHLAGRHVRFTYANSLDNLREGVARLERWLGAR